MQVSVSVSGRPPPPPPAKVQFQDLKGHLYVADDVGRGKVANVQALGDGSESAADIVLDSGLLDTPIGRYPVAMVVLKDVFFYDMMGWLAFTFVGGMLFALTTRITPLLHPVALPVAIGLFSFVAVAGYVAAATVAVRSTLWTPIALVSAGVAFTLYAVDMRVVAPIWYFLIQWAVSLSVLLYVVRVRVHIDLVDMRRVLALTTTVTWTIGLLTTDRTSTRDIIASVLLLVPCAVACLHRYWWIPRIIENNEFTVNDGLVAWENLYTQPPASFIAWTLSRCARGGGEKDDATTTIAFSPGPEL